MASQSAKNMLYCTCETGKLSGGAPGPVGSSPYGKISVCGRSMKKRILGCLRAKSRLTAAALRNTPAGVVPRTPFTRKGYAASVKRHSR